MTTEYIDVVVREKGAEAARAGIEAIGRSADVAAKKISALQALLTGLGRRTGGANPIVVNGGGGGVVPGRPAVSPNNQALQSLLSTVGGSAAIAAISRMANAYQNMTRTLSQFETAARPASAIMRELVGLANDTAQSTDATVQSYTRFRIATKDLGVSHEQLIPIQRTVQQLVALSTSSTQSASAAMYQFSQALASGRLQGDEFRSVMENAPRLAEAIANGMGKPISALRNMSQQGELTADKIIAALQKMRTTVDKEFANLALGPSQQFQRLRNNFEQAIGIIAQKSGTMATVAELFRIMADSVNVLAPLLLGLAANFTVLLVRSRAVVQTLALFGITGATALGLLTGPIGWLIAAVTGVILLFDKFQDSVISLGEKSATVGQIWQGMKNIFFNTLSSVGGWITTTADNLWKAFLEATGLAGTSVKDFVNDMVRGFVFIGDATKTYVSIIPDMFKLAFDKAVNFVLSAIDKMTGAVASGVNSMVDLLNYLPGVNVDSAVLGGTNLAASPFGESQKSFADILRQANDNLTNDTKYNLKTDYYTPMVTAAGAAVDSVKGFLIDLADTSGTTAKETETSLNKITAAAGKLTELQKLGQMFDKWGEPFAQAGSALKTLKELVDNGIISQDKMASSIERVREAFLRAGGTAKQWGQLIVDNIDVAAKKMQDWAVNGVKQLGDGLVDLAVTGKANFADMARSMIADMIKIMIQGTIMKQVLGFLGLPTMGFGFANGGAFSGGVQKFAAGGVFNTPQFFQFAKGGAPALGVLGEAGPEAILPLQRGADGRLGIMSQGGGGNSVVQNNAINITMQGSTGDQQKDDQYIQKVSRAMTAQLEGLIDQRMFDNMRYGGAFQPRGT